MTNLGVHLHPMHTPPHHLFVSRMPAAPVQSLANAVADAGRDLPGVNDAVEATGPLAQTWATRIGRTSTLITAKHSLTRRCGTGTLWPSGASQVGTCACGGTKTQLYRLLE